MGNEARWMQILVAFDVRMSSIFWPQECQDACLRGASISILISARDGPHPHNVLPRLKL